MSKEAPIPLPPTGCSWVCGPVIRRLKSIGRKHESVLRIEGTIRDSNGIFWGVRRWETVKNVEH